MHAAAEHGIQQHQLPRLTHAAGQREVDVVGGGGREQHGAEPPEPHVCGSDGAGDAPSRLLRSTASGRQTRDGAELRRFQSKSRCDGVR